ncbi:response regulator [Roseibacillus persicicus]|uniref:Response regulatory domain-containing protein n=1 Tax=Roseibacillus persicicus TaxID=454148 RepID=A0A918TCK3_9BACT|nr:response regulator [Roseibacillus persicicus]GHC41465.1 hypothetical protein GCM10007100_02800 [Roseibacillus persicicus]
MKQSPRILVVDDEPTLRLGFSLALRTEQYDVSAASNGREALDKISKEDFDLTVLDLRMPELDGLSTLNSLRQNGDDIPVILCSAHINASTAVQALEQHCFDFLCKPVRPSDLRDGVSRVLNTQPEKPFEQVLYQLRKGNYGVALDILEGSDILSPNRLGFWTKIIADLKNNRPLEASRYVEEYGQDLVRLLTVEEHC